MVGESDLLSRFLSISSQVSVGLLIEVGLFQYEQ